LKENVPNFVEPNVWPPNSPDLNPSDYVVWGASPTAVGISPENSRHLALKGSVIQLLGHDQSRLD